MEKVSVRGWYDPQYALVIDHEGYTPAIAAQVQIRDDIEYCINKKVHEDAIDFAIRYLKHPFLVVPNKNDLVSRSGMHSVEFSSDSLPTRGLYVLEKELVFPRPRPKIYEMEKLKKEYIAWVVSREEVYKLWILKYAGSADYVELTIPEDFELERLERLQGNLYYTHVELDEETKYSLPLRANFRIFDHKFEYDVYAMSFIHNNAVHAIVDTSNTPIHSEDETVTLEHGTYLLYHPFPRRD